MWGAQTQIDDAARRLERLAGKIHTREEQHRWIGAALALGVMLGIALWYVLPSLLPWGAGDWLASSLIGGGRWQAGETLMERASPELFDRMVRLYNACGERPTEMCTAAVAVRTAELPGQDGRTAGRGGVGQAAASPAPVRSWVPHVACDPPLVRGNAVEIIRKYDELRPPAAAMNGNDLQLEPVPR